MTGRALSVVELAEAFEAADRAYSGWLDDPCRRTVEDVERAAALLKATAAAVGRREAAAEVVELDEDHGGGCDGPANCVCSAVTL